MQQVIEKIVDFGASDAAMTPGEMDKVNVGVQLLPMTAGSIVLAYNLEGVDHLKLTHKAYVGIFLGKITKWNDAKIAAAESRLSLPDDNINVVVRSDGSDELRLHATPQGAGEEFAKQVGTNKQPNWPVGTKASKNNGVAASLIHDLRLDRLYRVCLCQAQSVETQDGRIAEQGGQVRRPDDQSGQATLAAITLPENLIAWMPDPGGGTSRIRSSRSPGLSPTESLPDAKKAQTLKDALNYCLTNRQKDLEPLGYIPLPPGTVSKVKAALDNVE